MIQITVVLYNAFIVSLFAYVTFGLGFSGWWWILGVALLTYSENPDTCNCCEEIEDEDAGP